MHWLHQTRRPLQILTSFSLQGYVGEDQLADALKGADIVIIPAGVPRKPGMTRDDLFNVSRLPCEIGARCGQSTMTLRQ